MIRRTPLKQLSLLLALVFVAVGCGASDDAVGNGDNNNNNQVEDNQNGGDSHQETDTTCDDGETFNPFLGHCVEESEEPVVCGPGLIRNPDLNVCQPDPNVPPECEAGQVYDAELEECVDGPSEDECGPGAILGQVCKPNGDMLSSADVVVVGVDCDGVPFQRQGKTDGSGQFAIENIPAGNHELLVTSGSFDTERDVIITAGETNEDMMQDAHKVCLESTVPIMILGGSFDNVSGLLDDLELDYDKVTGTTEIGTFLSDPAAMSEYGMIFAECGSTFGGLESSSFEIDIIINNLRSFVQQGNSLYASDWAYEYVDATFPNMVDFFGDNPLRGTGSQTVTADVLTAPMQTLLGSSTAQVFLNLSSWAVMEGADPPTSVHFRSDVGTAAGVVPDAPLLVTYTEPINQGTVVYTSFHNSAQADLSGTDVTEIMNFLIFQL